MGLIKNIRSYVSENLENKKWIRDFYFSNILVTVLNNFLVQGTHHLIVISYKENLINLKNSLYNVWLKIRAEYQVISDNIKNI